MKLRDAVEQKSNYVFLGEAGCGKSEIALNLALELAGSGEKPVHFFDLDMTKPLFRSRDAAALLEAHGVIVHFQEQFMDAPTAVGGPAALLRDERCYTILDVGGDYMGASAVGAYAPLLQRDSTVVYYVVNSYRPWSMQLEHIDAVLGQVLGAAHLPLSKLRFIGNPNLGVRTTAEEVLAGMETLKELLGALVELPFCCAWEELLPLDGAPLPLAPLRLYLTYPWEQGNI